MLELLQTTWRLFRAAYCLISRAAALKLVRELSKQLKLPRLIGTDIVIHLSGPTSQTSAPSSVEHRQVIESCMDLVGASLRKGDYERSILLADVYIAHVLIIGYTCLGAEACSATRHH